MGVIGFIIYTELKGFVFWFLGKVIFLLTILYSLLLIVVQLLVGVIFTSVFVIK